MMITKETAEAEKKAFISEHRTFAEAEGYDVGWSDYHRGWIVKTPRHLRPGEKVQTFTNIGMAWEVAAIRAGRKVGKPVPIETGRPRLEHVKQPPQKYKFQKPRKDVFE